MPTSEAPYYFCYYTKTNEYAFPHFKDIVSFMPRKHRLDEVSPRKSKAVYHPLAVYGKDNVPHYHCRKRYNEYGLRKEFRHASRFNTSKRACA